MKLKEVMQYNRDRGEAISKTGRGQEMLQVANWLEQLNASVFLLAEIREYLRHMPIQSEESDSLIMRINQLMQKHENT